MTDAPRRVALSKADRSTPEGRELIALLTELSADGLVTREELVRLRQWLEQDRGVDFPACGFLYEVVETISQDGEITEDELDSLALAIERVLPVDVRFVAALKRKERQAARRQEVAAQRAAHRAARAEERERAKPLRRMDFMIAGTRRAAGRREACENLEVGEVVMLEREPDNAHDENAILVVTDDGSELGYVPRDDARDVAPFLDAGAEADARVKKLLDTADGHVIPVVVATVRRGGAAPAEPQPPARPLPAPSRDLAPDPPTVVDRPVAPAKGPGVLLVTLAACLLLFAWVASC
jgi:hypothetical protein